LARNKKTQDQELQRLRQENTRLRRSVEELATLNELASVINSTMPLTKILDRVVSVSLKSVGAEQGTISLLDDENKDEPFKTWIRKDSTSTPGGKYRLDEYLNGWMINNCKPLRWDKANQEKAFAPLQLLDQDVRSILSVPLLLGGQIIGLINLFNKIEASQFSYEDEQLISILASQAAQVIENARLLEKERQLQKVEEELTIALEIQRCLLPRHSPQIPGFDIFGASYPARIVGGDFYDYITLNYHQVGVVLGDVCGKGISAALLMSGLLATIRAQAFISKNVGECVTHINSLLFNHTSQAQFTSLFYGLLDVTKKEFTYTNAGHPPAVVIRNSGVKLLEPQDTVLGIKDEIKYPQDTFKLGAGDLIFIYSDGVLDAMNSEGYTFGLNRLLEIVQKHSPLSPQNFLEKIIDEVKNYASNLMPHDDLTAVVIKIL
jgi:sigma-B regulation protein RsbU (phosphoserine phosphatase)